MRFSVGYNAGGDGDEPFPEIVADYLPDVAEVYFAWGSAPSGRVPPAVPGSKAERELLDQQGAELADIRSLGVQLNLLFNANCYGDQAVSLQLERDVGILLDLLATRLGGPVEAVTTTSPAVARAVRRHAPGVEVRASVNMRIGTAQAMSQVADLFDSFCLQRDVQRNPRHLAKLRKWADARGKRLSLLANSGCLAYCAGQTFHDNLVAHAPGINATANIADWDPTVCGRLMRDPAHWVRLLQATWVRPEDLHHYERLVDLVKLATRAHERPRIVIAAYVHRQFHGNLLNLLEPSHAMALAPAWIDNDAFPPDWFDRSATCDGACDDCAYCAGVLARVLRDAPVDAPT